MQILLMSECTLSNTGIKLLEFESSEIESRRNQDSGASYSSTSLFTQIHLTFVKTVNFES